ncbi:MAG TPA: VOC family protein [Acidobacteriaceae bacterium]|jgi:PhnB protein|nr:VOC family protein [Acidobacteriaceae bacterium]
MPPAPRSTLEPWLSVRGSARAVEFYKAAFSATETYRIDDGSRKVVSRLSVGNSEFWIGDESPDHHNFSPESLSGSTARMILTVDDPDAVFAQACAAGAHLVRSISEEYGWRVGRVVDPFGHHWEIGREIDPGS